MRLSKLFGRTLREVPADAEMVSHQLSLRAALVRQISTGIYSYLPLGWRVLKKIEQIMREEMDAIGGQDTKSGRQWCASRTETAGTWFWP